MAVATSQPPTSGPLAPPKTYSISVEDDTQEKLLDTLPTIDTLPLWKQMNILVPPRPKPEAAAHKWE